MSTVLKKPNKILWMIGCAIPFINNFVILALMGSVFKYIKILNPETKFSETKAVIWLVCTLGLYGLILPYVLMKETLESAALVGIEIPNHIVQFYVFTFIVPIFVVIVGWAIDDGVGAFLTILTGLITGPLSAHYFLKPFEIISDAYNS